MWQTRNIMVFSKHLHFFCFNFFFSLIEKKSFLFMMSLYYPPVVVNGDGRKDFQNFSSSTHTISTGAPQGCVLSLNTSVCTSRDSSVKLLKFADDTTLIGLIQDGDESDYCQVKLQEVKELAVLTTWSSTCSKQWRWSWTSGGTPQLSPHSPSWTAL